MKLVPTVLKMCIHGQTGILLRNSFLRIEGKLVMIFIANKPRISHGCVLKL